MNGLLAQEGEAMVAFDVKERRRRKLSSGGGGVQTFCVKEVEMTNRKNFLFGPNFFFLVVVIEKAKMRRKF